MNFRSFGYFLLLLMMLGGGVGCAADEPLPPTAAPIITATPTPLPTATATAVPPTATIPPEPTADLLHTGDLALLTEKFFVYPVPQLYAGDLATIQVTAYVPDLIQPSQVAVHVYINGELLVQDRLGGTNFAGDTTGIYPWRWDTTGLRGEQTVTVVLDPDDLILAGDETVENNTASYTVDILASGERPFRETATSWLSRDGRYATVHVLDQTAASRDLSQLVSLTDEAFEEAIGRLGLTPNRLYDVYFIQRVIGQGGYAGGSIVLTYSDRNYAGGIMRQVLVHEAVHLLDQQLAPRAIPFLREGVAVWAAGGHYQPEDLGQRMAALIQAGRYIPLLELVDNFYPAQHEIGYLQAGGLVHYLVEQYGWEKVQAWYGGMTAEGYTSHSAALDATLQANFGKSLAQIEQEWLQHLSQFPSDPQATNDLLATVRYYDMMRRYQELHDPTAYFLNAWLPSPQEMRQRGLTADVLRHPKAEINLLLEVMLGAADATLLAGDYQQANVILNSIERVLESGTVMDPLAKSYEEIVNKTVTMGFEVQRIEMNGNTATAYITSSHRIYLTPLEFARATNHWVLVN